MTAELTFRQIDRDEDGPIYGAFHEQQQIGRLYRSWGRLGGAGFTHTLAPGIVFSTLRQAKRDMSSRFVIPAETPLDGAS